jgi:oxaloacetate decarboxylase alpha subunit
MTTPMMLPIAEYMNRIGFMVIDAIGNVQVDVCVRYLKENPWERIRLLRERIPDTPLFSGIRSKCGISFGMIPDDVVELYVRTLIASGIRWFRAFDALFDHDNIVPSLRLAKELGMFTVGALVFSISPIHTDELYRDKAGELVERADVDAVQIKDSGGLLTPDRVRTLVPAIREAIGDRHLTLHSHCMTGLAPLVYLEGAKAGVDSVHCSIAPLANGPAQPATQTVVRNLRAMGFRVNIDDELVDKVGNYLWAVAKKEKKPVGVPLEYDAYHYEHQMPGGMLTNFKRQLTESGLADRYDEVLAESIRVRKELGWPIMVTPFSQVVINQALFNVIHGERYRVVPDEVKLYVLGHYGKLPAPVDSDVSDRIIENGSKHIPLQPRPLEPGLPKVRQQYPGASDEELVLRYMFHGSYVDDMLASGPIRDDYRVDQRNDLIGLMEALLKQQRFSSIAIRKGDFRLKLRR